MQRYQEFLGQPPRKHPGHGEWTLSDKINYIKHQVNTRSRQSSVLSPLVHRLKYDIKMIQAKPQTFSALFGWLIAYIKKHL